MTSKHKEGLNYWPSFVDIFASLFFIFLIIFSVHYTRACKDAKIAKDKINELETKLRKFEEKDETDREDIEDLKKMVKALNIELDGDNNLVISGDLLFDSGKSYIKRGKAEAFATSFAAELSEYFKAPERQKKYSIVVEGHTDTVDSEAFNNNLSLNRALSFIGHIKLHLNRSLQNKIEFIPAGYGETKLRIRTPDKTNEQRNRRVVIRIMPKFNRTLDSIFKKS